MNRVATDVGLAIFVKTPGHSPVKTRLAASLGAEAATEFHRLAAAAVAAVVTAASEVLTGLKAHWAVAEEEALDDPAWKDLPRLAQGSGDLGSRMRTVSTTLLATHGRAVLLGADAPQIRVTDLVDAVTALETHDHVLGPAADGGFWLLGTRRHIPDTAWDTTPWSQSRTAERFAARLDQPAAKLRTLRDVDTADDLRPVLDDLRALPDPLPERLRLAEWLGRVAVVRR